MLHNNNYSILESFAHGVPYLTLEKSSEIYQCVEYSYIIHGFNGLIFRDLKEVRNKIINMSNDELNRMKHNCIEYVNRELALSSMVNKFVQGLNT